MAKGKNKEAQEVGPERQPGPLPAGLVELMATKPESPSEAPPEVAAAAEGGPAPEVCGAAEPEAPAVPTALAAATLDLTAEARGAHLDRVEALARDLYLRRVAAGGAKGFESGHVVTEAFTAAETFFAEADKRRGD